MCDLRFWNDGTHFWTRAQLCMLPRWQDDRTHVVVVVYKAWTRLLCSFIFSFQHHCHRVHRHQSIPRNHHGHLLRLERLTLEIQCYWAAAIHQNIKTATIIHHHTTLSVCLSIYLSLTILITCTQKLRRCQLSLLVIRNKTRSSATAEIARDADDAIQGHFKVFRCCANRRGIHYFPLALNSNLTSI